MKKLALAGAVLAAIAIGASAAAPRGSRNEPVSSSSELVSALRKARLGDVILVAPGDYKGLAFQNLKLQGVVVKSAISGQRAVIGPFVMENSSGITFRDLEFSNEGAEANWSWRIVKSQDIHFDHVDMHGSLDGNPQNDRQGIQIRLSSKISIKNSEFHELYRCISPSETSDIEISNNRFHDNARTGIFSSNVQNVLIANNSFTDSYPVEGDHMDAIAFTRIGPTNTTRNVVVKENVITRGKGRVTQGIFFRDSTKGVTRFTDIRISDNLIVGMGYNGIFIAGAENVIVERNTVVAYPGKTNNSWIMLSYVKGGQVRDNRAPLISVTPPRNNNVDVVESGSKLTSPVTDEGAKAMAEYVARMKR